VCSKYIGVHTHILLYTFERLSNRKSDGDKLDEYKMYNTMGVLDTYYLNINI